MIVETEYEAAWKQAERAFQDVLKLALADIGKATRQIDRNTKQLRKDSEAIHKTLASIAREPNAPLLSLSFSEPGKPWILPHARDKDRSLKEGLIAEARRNGVPDFKWVSEALAALRKRAEEARYRSVLTYFRPGSIIKVTTLASGPNFFAIRTTACTFPHVPTHIQPRRATSGSLPSRSAMDNDFFFGEGAPYAFTVVMGLVKSSMHLKAGEQT